MQYFTVRDSRKETMWMGTVITKLFRVCTHHFKFIVRLHESLVVLMVFSLGLVQDIALFKSVEYKASDRKGPKNYLKMWD